MNCPNGSSKPLFLFSLIRIVAPINGTMQQPTMMMLAIIVVSIGFLSIQRIPTVCPIRPSNDQ